jgi:hypothetical protein
MIFKPKSLDDLIRSLACSIDATEAVAFSVRRHSLGDAELDSLLHLRPDNAPSGTRAAAVAAFRELIRPCVLVGKDGALEVGETDGVRGPQFCLIKLARHKKDVVGAGAFIVRRQNIDAAQKVLARLARWRFRSFSSLLLPFLGRSIP